MSQKAASSHNIFHRLMRTKSGTGDDTDYPAGATVPPDGIYELGPIAPAGKGHNSQLEFCVVAVDASGAVQAPTGTFTARVVHVMDRSHDQEPGDSWPDVAIGTEALTSQAFNTMIRTPVNGGRIFVALSSISRAPGGATDFQVWGKPAAG